MLKHVFSRTPAVTIHLFVLSAMSMPILFFPIFVSFIMISLQTGSANERTIHQASERCYNAAKGKTRFVLLNHGKSRFFNGVINAPQGLYSVDLVEQNGAHSRHFFHQKTGENRFRFKATKTQRLKLEFGKAGRYCLKLENPDIDHQKSTPAPVEDFLSPTLQQLAKTGFQPDEIRIFWEKIVKAGTPLIEKSEGNERIITFLQRGAKQNVFLLGAPSGDHEKLVRLGTTDIWYKSFKVPSDTRFSYQLAVDVPEIKGTPQEKRMAISYTVKADPLNLKLYPVDAPDPYNQESVVELENAPAQNWIPAQSRLVSSDNRKVTTENFYISSLKLGNRHKITLYKTKGVTKRGVGKNGIEPVVLFVFDGEEYQTRVPLPAILDKMVEAQVIAPTIAVFIHNIDRKSRMQELPGNPDFADFLAFELLPEIERRMARKFPPSRIVLAGSSFGGLAAMTVALRHPDKFGHVLSMSGSFWWSPENGDSEREDYVSRVVAMMPSPPLSVFLSVGVFEGGHSGGQRSLLDANRHLFEVLLAKQVPVVYREYSGGHDYIVWQGAISDGLMALFPEILPQ